MELNFSANKHYALYQVLDKIHSTVATEHLESTFESFKQSLLVYGPAENRDGNTTVADNEATQGSDDKRCFSMEEMKKIIDYITDRQVLTYCIMIEVALG